MSRDPDRRDPADGAEQADLSMAAGMRRVGSRFATPAHRSDEAADGFDTAYLSWREVQGDQHDSDYRRWRAETGRPFSQAFVAWLRAQPARPGSGGGPQ